MSETDELEALRARVERERRARRQAEAITEQGMREVWELQRRLDLDVAAADDARELAVAALRIERRHRHLAALEALERLTAVDRSVGEADEGADDEGDDEGDAAACADRIRHLLAPGRPEPPVVRELDLRAVADGIVDRWQRPAARRGQLLVAEVDTAPDAAQCEWHRFVAVADVLVGALATIGAPGELDVAIGATAGEVTLRVRGAAPSRPDGATEPTLDAELLVAERIVAEVGGAIERELHRDGTLTVCVRLPVQR